MAETNEPDQPGKEPTRAELLAAITDWKPRPVDETDPERLAYVTRRLRSGSVELSPRRAGPLASGEAPSRTLRAVAHRTS